MDFANWSCKVWFLSLREKEKEAETPIIGNHQQHWNEIGRESWIECSSEGFVQGPEEGIQVPLPYCNAWLAVRYL